MPTVAEIAAELGSLDNDKCAAAWAELKPAVAAAVAEYLRAQVTWMRTPGSLAQTLDPTTVQTPALEVIDKALVDAYAGRDPNLIISLPPQTGKSSRCARYFGLWLLCKNPDLKIAIVSFDGELAAVQAAAIRNDILTFDGTEGNLDLGLRLRRDSKAIRHFTLEGHRGGIYTTSVAASLSGRAVDAILIDDPVKDYRAADSVLVSEHTWTWWQSVARPRRGPNPIVVVASTRWSEHDLSGRLEAKEREDRESGALNYDRWRVINIPAQADHRPELGEADPLGREPGEWLVTPRGTTAEQWETTKTATGSPRIWSALYQGRPSPIEGGEIKRFWWRYSDRPPERADDAISAWDMKLKEKRSGDYVAGGMWYRVGSKFYLMSVLRGQWDFPTVTNAIALMSVRFPRCTRHAIENTGNGPEVMEALRKADKDYGVSDTIAGELGMTWEEREAVQALRRRGMSGLIADNPKGSKVARVRAISGLIEAGDVILPGTGPTSCPRWVTTFVDECASFGVGGAHDDQIDQMSAALRRLNRGTERKSSAVAVGRVPGTRLPTASNPARAMRVPLRTSAR